MYLLTVKISYKVEILNIKIMRKLKNKMIEIIVIKINNKMMIILTVDLSIDLPMIQY